MRERSTPRSPRRRSRRWPASCSRTPFWRRCGPSCGRTSAISGSLQGGRSSSTLPASGSGARQKTGGEHQQVTGWYAFFSKNVVAFNASVSLSYLVTFGELLAGLALMFIPATRLVLAWRAAGHWGLDGWFLSRLVVAGSPGTMFRRGQAAGEGHTRPEKARHDG